MVQAIDRIKELSNESKAQVFRSLDDLGNLAFINFFVDYLKYKEHALKKD